MRPSVSERRARKGSSRRASRRRASSRLRARSCSRRRVAPGTSAGEYFCEAGMELYEENGNAPLCTRVRSAPAGAAGRATRTRRRRRRSPGAATPTGAAQTTAAKRWLLVKFTQNNAPTCGLRATAQRTFTSPGTLLSCVSSAGDSSSM